eukprot:Protomagalhaensia_wolfi_Nauph_80__6284@NODE_965_length_1848_cov_226_147595_g730_i0_p1_GENE_NODE_965_length_1848_cov_226_147595_g730_i0NODE_965_length_1848_cov_226_147595_g730_i0_p1_ORF_typecomplete_len306_score51_74Integrin_beta/PF00362_18/6_7e42_NODE_965_length_1848_cov_226_147595_g730_i01711088
MQLLIAGAISTLVVVAQKYGVLPYYHTIDLMWLQDFSATYEDDLTNLKHELPNLFDDLRAIFPHSKFGLGGFVDKPMGEFGYEESSDYCYHMKYPLTRYTSHIQEALELSKVHSGADWAESQLHAMLGAALSKETRWSELPMTPNGYKIHRLMVVNTDAGYHQAGDATSLPSNNADGVEDCLGEDYPSVEQVAEALNQEQITPLFLVTEEVAPLYRGLVRALGDNGVVYPIADDSSDIATATQHAINLALGNPCGDNEICSAGCYGTDCCDGEFECNNDPAAAIVIKLSSVPKQVKVAFKQSPTP